MYIKTVDEIAKRHTLRFADVSFGNGLLFSTVSIESIFKLYAFSIGPWQTNMEL